TRGAGARAEPVAARAAPAARRVHSEIHHRFFQRRGRGDVQAGDLVTTPEATIEVRPDARQVSRRRGLADVPRHLRGGWQVGPQRTGTADEAVRRTSGKRAATGA